MKKYPDIKNADRQIKEAMQVLEGMPTDSAAIRVGSYGPSLVEILKIEERGGIAFGDAGYHQSQKAWTLLNAARVNLIPPIKNRR